MKPNADTYTLLMDAALKKKNYDLLKKLMTEGLFSTTFLLISLQYTDIAFGSLCAVTCFVCDEHCRKECTRVSK